MVFFEYFVALMILLSVTTIHYFLNIWATGDSEWQNCRDNTDCLRSII